VGDATASGGLVAGLPQQPAAAVVSGLPLFNAAAYAAALVQVFGLMPAGAPSSVHLQCGAAIPKHLDRVRAEASSASGLTSRRHGSAHCRDDGAERRDQGYRPILASVVLCHLLSCLFENPGDPGSLRARSYNVRSPRLRRESLADVDVTRISLLDIRCRSTTVTVEKSGAAQCGQARAADVRAPGRVIASPEYNASIRR
jgi:hypothetical protein